MTFGEIRGSSKAKSSAAKDALAIQRITRICHQLDGIVAVCLRVEKTWWLTRFATQAERKDSEAKFSVRARTLRKDS
jgi:hypothetical protein